MDLTRYVASERDTALLVGDYSTYRSQATRRIHALRKRLGRTTPKGRKFSPKALITAEEIGRNDEYAKLLTMCAERAWAAAMAMKNAHSTENTQSKITGSTKKQIISKFNRAIQYAKHLVSCLRAMEASPASNIDILEAEAYMATLRGGMQFEKASWDACIRQYSVARVIYATLGAETRGDVFKDQLSTTVDPSIRYAAYKSKLPRTKAVSELATERFPSDERGLREEIESINADGFTSNKSTGQVRNQDAGDTSPTITWRSRTVKIEDAIVSQAVVAANRKERELSEAKLVSRLPIRDLATAYDDVINARQDAVDATRLAIDELTEEGVDKGDMRVQSLQITRTALYYAVIELRIGRTRVLCGPNDGAFADQSPSWLQQQRKKDRFAVSKTQSINPRLRNLRERVTLYDSVLQDIDTVKELPGVPADADFLQELGDKRSYFRALKCLTTGQAHAVIGELTNALALLAKSLEVLTTTMRGAVPSESGQVPRSQPGLLKLEIKSKDLTNLHEHLTNSVSKYQALVVLNQRMDEKKVAEQGRYRPPLAERLHEFPIDGVDLTNLVSFPPKLQPIPVKPLFFDLAWNYIEYPGRPITNVSGSSSAPKQTAEERKEPAKKGWFGFAR